jgi:hypothetical protein
MLTTEAVLICCSSRVYGPPNASPARWMIVSIAPLESATPNSSRASSVVSRRETRFLTASVTTAACSRGPNADRGTSRGSSARVRVAHAGQQTPCSRCSVTRTAVGGSSATWCRHGSAAATRSSSPNTRAHDRHRSGQRSITSSTGSAGAAADTCPRDQAAHPGPGPTPSRPDAAAPTANPATAAATSSANSGSAAAQAQPPQPQAAGSPRPTPRSATTTPPPSHDHHQRSPRPQPAPHRNIRHHHQGPFKGLNAYQNMPICRHV